MARYLFTAAAALSTVLCAVTLLLWPMGHWRRLTLHYRFGWTQVGVQAETGHVALVRYGYPVTLPRGWFGGALEIDATDTPRGMFDVGHLRKDPLHSGDNDYDAVWAPSWLVAGVAGVMPAVWLAGHRRRRALSRPGHCRACGYDVRASPERCPECGTVAVT